MDDTTVKRTLFANVGAPADEALLKISSSIRSKIQYQLKEQQDEKALLERHLPKIPKAYNLPVMQSYVMGKNQPIVANESHCKATNNGYSRNALGGFFAH
jgi:hypothetical protein